MIEQITPIQNNFTFTPVPSVLACSASGAITQVYSYSTSCDLPSCAQNDCVEIFLYENNTLGRSDSRRLTVKYFNDCDKKILDMLESGEFLPKIPALDIHCQKAAKEWEACATEINCDNYGEKASCPTPTTLYKKYSKKYSIVATGH
jgi:hypothetical protein